MKILIVTDSYLPRIDGVSLAVALEAKALSAEGHEVRVMAVSAGDAHDTSFGAEYSINVFRPIVFGPSKYPIVLLPGRRVKQELRFFNPESVRIETLGPLGLTAFALARRQDIPCTLVWNIDPIEMASRFPATSLILLVYAALRGHHRPSFPLADVSGTIGRAMTTLLLQFDEIVVPSNKAYCQVGRTGYHGRVSFRRRFPEEAQSVIGTQTLIDRPKTEVRVVTFLGRVSREKGLDLLLEAFALAKEVDDALFLRLIGPLDDRRTVRAVRQWMRRHPGCAALVGPIPPASVRQELISSSVLVVPSLVETQCLALSEARSVELPVVVVDRQIAMDHLHDTGVRVSEPHPKALAAAMLSALSDHARYHVHAVSCASRPSVRSQPVNDPDKARMTTRVELASVNGRDVHLSPFLNREEVAT